MPIESKSDFKFNIDLGRTIGKNTLFSVVAKIIRVGIRMLMVPVVIHYIGLDGFGIWAVIAALASYMTLGVAGSGAALQKYVAESTGTGDFDRASSVLSVGGSLVFVFSISILVPLALLSHKLPQIMNIPKGFTVVFLHSLTILAIAMIFSNIGAVYGSIVMGGHRIDLARIVDLICVLIESVSIFLLLIYGFGILGLAISLASAEVIRGILYFILSARVLPSIKIRPSKITRPVIKGVIPFIAGYQLLNCLEIAYASILPLLILKYFDPELTGIFAVCSRLINVAILIPEAFLLPLLSGAAWIYAKRKFEQFSFLLHDAMKFTLTVLVPILVFLSLFGNKIFFGLTGHQDHLVLPSLILLSGAILFKAVSRNYFIMYRAAGGTWRDIIWTIIRILLLWGAFGLGIHFWQYNGGLIAYLLTELVGMIFMQSTIKKTMQTVQLRSMLSDFLKLIIGSLFICSICATLILLPLPLFGKDRFIALLHTAIASLLFLLMGGYTLWKSGYLSLKEKESVKSILLNLNMKQFARAKYS
ncbi:MAG: lipopolysaccharide biosynthesis protein [Candidatus Hodarchaeota archaeon]